MRKSCISHTVRLEVFEEIARRTKISGGSRCLVHYYPLVGWFCPSIHHEMLSVRHSPTRSKCATRIFFVLSVLSVLTIVTPETLQHCSSKHRYRNMQLRLLLTFLVGSASAFQPATFVVGRTSPAMPTTTLFANSKNIRAAMEATEMYGPTSPEARVAWEGENGEAALW